jgi:SAM-dependent methyltransferase
VTRRDTTEKHAADRAVAAGSPDRFGFEWQTYSELRQEYEEQFRRWTSPIDPSEWRDRTFIDVGCGMGRNSYWPMTYGARAGVAIDVNDASLASARRTLSSFPTVSVRHLSAYDIDYRDEFDIAFSIGVIHHLENPQRALEAMVRAVKPGGRVLIWVYGLENNEWIVRLVSPLRRLLFSRLPIGLLHWLSWLPAAALWLALRLGLGRTEYARQTRQFTFRHLRSIVFDQLLPKIAHYWPRATVAAMMSDAGLTDAKLVAVNEISWAALGTKPMNGDETQKTGLPQGTGA